MGYGERAWQKDLEWLVLSGSVAARGSEGGTAVIYGGRAGQAGQVLTGGAGGPGAGSLWVIGTLMKLAGETYTIYFGES